MTFMIQEIILRRFCMNLALTFLILKKCLRRLVPILVSSLSFDGFIFEGQNKQRKQKQEQLFRTVGKYINA